MQSPRAFRTTELAKELVRQGHHVTIYALLGNYDYSSFQKETGIEVKSLGISKWGNMESNGSYKRNVLTAILNRTIKRYIYFPFIELTWLTKKVVQREWKNYDLLITIAFPHSIHWGAALAKGNKKQFIKWISDCGDPFMGDKMNSVPKYFKYIEKYWCKRTDYITVPIEGAIKAYYPEYRDKIRVIPQGFDFSSISSVQYRKNAVPTFAFAGKVYPGTRDPGKFLEYLTTINEDYKFIVFTKEKDFFEKYKPCLGNKLEINGYITRNELLEVLGSMDFLLNIVNESDTQSPSKLIDYALAKRPILDITSSFEECELFSSFLKGDYSGKHQDINVSQYDIKRIAELFIEL
jgi:hypothetical protein